MLPSPIWGCDRSDKTNMYRPDKGSFMFSAVREVQRRSTGTRDYITPRWKSLQGIGSRLGWALKGGFHFQCVRMVEEEESGAEART